MYLYLEMAQAIHIHNIGHIPDHRDNENGQNKIGESG